MVYSSKKKPPNLYVFSSSTEEASISPTHQTTSPPTTTPLPSVPAVKLLRGPSGRQQLMRNWNRPVNVPKFAFNDTLPFPTVYFPATVIEGEFKKKGRLGQFVRLKFDEILQDATSRSRK